MQSPFQVYKITNLKLTMTSDSVFCIRLTLDKTIEIREFEVDVNRKYRYKSNNGVRIFFKELIEKGKLVSGKYIYAKLGFGKRYIWIESIRYFDIVFEFEKELREKKYADFITALPIYEFLAKIGRSKNSDESISLTGEWYGRKIFNVDRSSFCVIEKYDYERLNYRNIELIFNNFYKNKPLPKQTDEDEKPLRYEMQKYSGIFLVKYVDRVHSNFHKSRSRNDYCGESYGNEIKLGELLSDEQKKFLADLKHHSQIT